MKLSRLLCTLKVRKFFVPETGKVPNTRAWFPRHQYIGMLKVSLAYYRDFMKRRGTLSRKRIIVENCRHRGTGDTVSYRTLCEFHTEMTAAVRDMDAVIEVHDARIPLCGRNSDFAGSIYAGKPHILILNKIDLVELAQREGIVTKILKEKHGVKHVLWANMKSNMKGVLRSVMDILIEEAEQQPRYQKLYKSHYESMVIGVPNVGKSTLINALRAEFTGHKGTLIVGDKPGVTRAIHNKMRVYENPSIFIRDTPGVTAPDVSLGNTALKLAVCNTVDPKMVAGELVADFLLWHMNSRQRFEYLPALGMPGEPTDSVFNFLVELAQTRGTRKVARGQKHLDLDGAAALFLRCFREGKFGDQFLDDDVIEMQERHIEAPQRRRLRLDPL